MVTDVARLDRTLVSLCIDDGSTEFESVRCDSVKEFLANLILGLFWIFVVFKSINKELNND